MSENPSLVHNNSDKEVAKVTPESKARAVSRPLFMTNIQKIKLKDYLSKPIKHFDVVIDDMKKSRVWRHFGELVFKDPESGDIHIIDTSRRYCLQCIIVAQKINPLSTLVNTDIRSYTNKTLSDKFRKHLKDEHQIIAEPLFDNGKPGSTFKKKPNDHTINGNDSSN